MFAAEIYQQRRRDLCERLDGGIVLLLGNGESPMNYADNIYPFRQDSSFLYFFGLDQADLAGAIDIDSGEEIVFGNDLTIDDIVWTGPQPTVAERAAKVGCAHARPMAALADLLTTAHDTGRRVHFLPPYRPANTVRLHELLAISLAEVAGTASPELIQAVITLRSVKSVEEIAELDRAVDISNEMHLTAMRVARPGMKESRVAAAVRQVAESHGGQTSFPLIMTVHGETLHNVYQGNVIQEDDLILCDAGAETDTHYASDLTRTFPAGLTYSSQQRDIHAVVLAGQEAAVSALRPGIPYRDVHLLAARVIAGGLADLGLMHGDLDAAVEAGAHALFFPHGLGHMMGMDVHDMENLGEDRVGYGTEFQRSTQFGLKSLRLARALEAGFVLTVEPGVYFIPALIERWQADGQHREFIAFDKLAAFRNFGGLRLEDDYLITADGARKLGAPLAKTVAEIEAVRAS